MTTLWARAAAIASITLLTMGSQAQDATEPELTSEEQQTLAEMRALWESLDRKTGTIELGGDLATLDVPEDFYFLGAEDTERVLVAWGNPPGQENIGMLFPAEYTPFDDGTWAVTIQHIDDGHVSDSDAAHIDYTQLLNEMRSDIRAGNAERQAAGYEPIELVGWAEPPHYDESSRKLYWAKELKFGQSADSTLNYEIRALGRTGILSMTFIADTAQLDEINGHREAVLGMAAFNPGQRYEDFDSNVDEVAAYGIGALIAGKVAAKAGLLAGGLVLLKKFGVLLVIGVAALGRKLKGVFSRDAKT